MHVHIVTDHVNRNWSKGLVILVSYIYCIRNGIAIHLCSICVCNYLRQQNIGGTKSLANLPIKLFGRRMFDESIQNCEYVLILD